MYSQSMQQLLNRQKRQTYEPPRVEVIEIEPQAVMCGSAIDGNSTESIGIGGFGWI